MAQHSWSERSVPAELVERYEREEWWTDNTLGGKVAEWLAAAPDATVNIHSRSVEWHGTYADIDDEARRLIALLRAEGLEPGAIVAFQLPNWREAIVSFAALTMGGYVLVPIVHIYGRKEVAFILAECGADAYIAPASYGHVDYTAIVDEAAPPGLRVHVVVGDGADQPAPDGIRRVGWDSLASFDPVTDLPTPRADEVAVLAYTSGTTSDPKGVIHDHRTMLSELRHMNGWVAGRATLMGSPVTHATGMLGAVLGPLGRGGDMHVIDRWDPGHALEVMAAYDISGGTGASIFLATLLDHPDFTPAHAANMERIGLGGAPVPVELGRRAEAARHQDHPRLRLDRASLHHRQPVRRPGRSTTHDRRAGPAGSGAPPRRPRRRRRSGRCRGRDPVARPGTLPRLHQPDAQRRLRRRRLVPHRRHRHRRRTRLPDDHRSREGHHHPRR